MLELNTTKGRKISHVLVLVAGFCFPLALVIGEVFGRFKLPCLLQQLAPMAYLVLVLNTLVIRFFNYKARISFEKTVAANLYERSTIDSVQLKDVIRRDSAHHHRRQSSFKVGSEITGVPSRNSETNSRERKRQVRNAGLFSSISFSVLLSCGFATIYFVSLGAALEKKYLYCGGCSTQVATIVTTVASLQKK